MLVRGGEKKGKKAQFGQPKISDVFLLDTLSKVKMQVISLRRTLCVETSILKGSLRHVFAFQLKLCL